MRKLFLVLFALVSLLTIAIAGPRVPAMPLHGYVIDGAKLLTSDAVSEINNTANAVKQDTKSPIVVVTITSLSAMDAEGYTIDTYATYLFNKWKIGSASINKGVLLLVSKGDRKARIETGAGWAHSKDSETHTIMQESIIPKFKAGDYNAGILAGVKDIDTMIRGGSITASSSNDSPNYQNYSTGYTDSSDSNSFGSAIGMLFICPAFIVFVIIAGFIGALRSGGRRYYGNGYRGGGLYGGNYFNQGVNRPGVFDSSSTSSSGFFDSGSSSGGFSGGSDFSGGGSSDGGGSSGSW
jgi:uncharacterized protein